MTTNRSQREKTPCRDGARILVIDDEPVLRHTFKRLLEGEGYRTWVAVDGDEGMRLFHDIHPDIVITDMIMPGMDGFKLIEILRREDPELPIIAMSAMVDESAMSRPVEEGTFCCLSKPVDHRMLFELIQAILMPPPDGPGEENS